MRADLVGPVRRIDQFHRVIAVPAAVNPAIQVHVKSSDQNRPLDMWIGHNNHGISCDADTGPCEEQAWSEWRGGAGRGPADQKVILGGQMRDWARWPTKAPRRAAQSRQSSRLVP
jgi:hypothetical protein